jgi:hypothetical protein
MKSKNSRNIRQQASPCQSLFPTNAAPGAGDPDISPRCSTAAVTKSSPIDFFFMTFLKERTARHATNVLLKPIGGTENTLAATI